VAGGREGLEKLRPGVNDGLRPVLAPEGRGVVVDGWDDSRYAGAFMGAGPGIASRCERSPGMPVKYQRFRFSCFIQDAVSGDKFSADVEIKKRSPIRQSLQRDGKVELADIFISHKLAKPDGPGGTRYHSHFVLQNLNGGGLYIVRSAHGNEETRRESSIWDFGHVFGDTVTRTLQSWA
jgi:hypothetical protein